MSSIKQFVNPAQNLVRITSKRDVRQKCYIYNMLQNTHARAMHTPGVNRKNINFLAQKFENKNEQLGMQHAFHYVGIFGEQFLLFFL